MSNVNDFLIRNDTLYKYSGMERDVVVPDGVVTIEGYAFNSNSAYKSITLPQSVRVVMKNAFYNCHKLKSLIIPSVNIQFRSGAFVNCPDVRLQIADMSGIKTKEKLSVLYAVPEADADDETFAHVLLYQKENKWMAWLLQKAEDSNEVVRAAIKLLSDDIKPTPAIVKRIIEFMLEKEKEIQAAEIDNMLDMLKSKGCKVDRKQFKSLNEPEESKSQKEISAGKSLDLNINDYEFADEALACVKNSTKIHNASGKGYADIAGIRILISEYVREWERCRSTIRGELSDIEALTNAKDVKFSVIADQIADTLNREELNQLLRGLGDKVTKYRPYILAYARFATDCEVEYIISQISQRSKGKAQGRYWATSMKEALLVNDTRTAMLYFDKHNRLDEYAKIRGMSVQELRDSRLMPEFGFDADGVKRYDIGGNTIEVTVNRDLTITLFDVNAGKTVKSIPKKSEDAAKAQACADDFKVFKKSISDFYKLRMKFMHDLHLSGDIISNEIWNRIYVKHPVLKHLSALLVWQDERGKSFIPTENGIIDACGQVYKPQGNIALAHVLSMQPKDLYDWQKYLTKNQIVQPFGQMWEPIINWSENDVQERYKDAVLTKDARSALKKALGTWGVDVHSEEMEREFDHRAGKYVYSNVGTMNFGNCFMMDYTVNDDGNTLTFGKGAMASWNNLSDVYVNRAMNAILYHMDISLVRRSVEQDRVHVFTEDVLSRFTLAQITEFINVAVENNCTNVSAILLDYKNRIFADFDPMDAFSLEW